MGELMYIFYIKYELIIFIIVKWYNIYINILFRDIVNVGGRS